ncbi:MAG: D-glycero-beta-D-manno-heptose 1-phosphate adenylyltransferase [Saprospiraceae bacterium]|nr:D-glycero-beta-D-manno-heptose 1-phosphate adenylyltransferase [Saprospiraceae bacterium]
MILEGIKNKIMDLEEIVSWSRQKKQDGQKLVFTNGCFDLIHLGHLQYLSQAKELGDLLIIGVNSDSSVERLKGPGRPVKDEYSRASLLAALTMVDAVTIFKEDTPLNLIKQIQPDMLCKGGDWHINQIVGAREVLDNGGEVKSLPFLQGHSTTSLVQKARQE